MGTNKSAAISAIDSIAQELWELSDAIWDAPETNFEEVVSAQLQCRMLEKLGFRVEESLAGIPTAFSGTWGSGKPVIGIMGEFDALSGLSQKAGVAQEAPIVHGGNGHGCGHNMLGVGGIAAAYAVKEYLKMTGKPGTVTYYGCPAEEGGSGKTFMVRDGVFDHLDCALYWHPGTLHKVNHDSTLANFAVDYHFKGVSAHAAAAPHQGRSALDGVEMMNMGVQFLREHVLPSVRIHYAITNTGGISPNVVQAEAEVSYLIRAPKVSQVQSVYERVNKIAQGAALMSETELEIRFAKGCSDQVINQSMNEVMQANLDATPVPEMTAEDVEFANAIRESLGVKEDSVAGLVKLLSEEEGCWVREQTLVPMRNFPVPLVRKERVLPASGDLGDVSYLCPTGELSVATWAVGTHGHSWQATAQGKSPWAHKCLIFAGKVLAGTAIDLLDDPEKLEKAKQEHSEKLKEHPYVCPIPKDIQPPKPKH